MNDTSLKKVLKANNTKIMEAVDKKIPDVSKLATKEELPDVSNLNVKVDSFDESTATLNLVSC